MVYIHGLIIDCTSISIPAQNSINTRALQHEHAMVHEYAKHSQAILTTYYEDIKSMPRARCCPKPKVLMRQWVIEDDNMTPKDNSGCLTLEVVAAASADIVDRVDEDGTASPAPEPAAAAALAATSSPCKKKSGGRRGKPE